MREIASKPDVPWPWTHMSKGSEWAFDLEFGNEMNGLSWTCRWRLSFTKGEIEQAEYISADE